MAQRLRSNLHAFMSSWLAKKLDSIRRGGDRSRYGDPRKTARPEERGPPGPPSHPGGRGAGLVRAGLPEAPVPGRGPDALAPRAGGRSPACVEGALLQAAKDRLRHE